MRALALWTILLAACQTTNGKDDAKGDPDTDGPEDTDVSGDSDAPDDTDGPDNPDDSDEVGGPDDTDGSDDSDDPDGPDDSDDPDGPGDTDGPRDTDGPGDTDGPVDTDAPADTDDSAPPVDSDVPMEDCTDGPALIAGVAYASLGDAIDASQPGDTVEVCAGTHTGSYTVVHDLTLVGLSGLRPELNANGNSLFNLTQGSLTLDRLLLTGAIGDDGSVIRNDGSGTLTLHQVHVVGNFSDGSGVLDGGAAPMILDNTRVESNTVDSNGALVRSDGPITAVDSVFESNTATRAANILYATSSLDLTSVEFLENTTEDAPVLLTNGALTADRLTLMLNMGASIFVHQDGAADVRNLVATGNWALSGSVIAFFESDPLVLDGGDLTQNIVFPDPSAVNNVLSIVGCAGTGAYIDVFDNLGGANAWGLSTLNSTLTLTGVDVTDFEGEVGISFQWSDIEWRGGSIQASEVGAYVVASTVATSDLTFEASVGEWALYVGAGSTVDVEDGQASCADAGFVVAIDDSQVALDGVRVRDASVVASTDASIATVNLLNVALDVTADVCVDGACSPLAAGPAVSACVGAPCP